MGYYNLEFTNGIWYAINAYTDMVITYSVYRQWCINDAEQKGYLFLD